MLIGLLNRDQDSAIVIEPESFVSGNQEIWINNDGYYDSQKSCGNNKEFGQNRRLLNKILRLP